MGSAAPEDPLRLQYALALSIMVGLLLFVYWYFRLAFLSNFLSRAVLVGFISGLGLEGFQVFALQIQHSLETEGFLVEFLTLLKSIPHGNLYAIASCLRHCVDRHVRRHAAGAKLQPQASLQGGRQPGVLRVRRGQYRCRIDRVDGHGQQPIAQRRNGGVRGAEFWITLVGLVSVLALGPLKAVIIAFLMSTIDVVRRASKPSNSVMAQSDGEEQFAPVDPHQMPPTKGLLVYRFGAPLYFANASVFQDQCAPCSITII